MEFMSTELTSAGKRFTGHFLVVRSNVQLGCISSSSYARETVFGLQVHSTRETNLAEKHNV